MTPTQISQTVPVIPMASLAQASFGTRLRRWLRKWRELG